MPLQDGYIYNAQREDALHRQLKMNALPSNSISSKTSFDSPLRTLRESVKECSGLYISTHDIIEAYSVLSTRIRHTIQAAPCITSSSMLCFQTFAEFSSDIVHCVSRDIQCLLPSPFDTQPLQDYSVDLMHDMNNETDWEDIQVVIDNKTLCQHALRFTSDLFAFPALYSQFTDDSLTSLLRRVLSLCSIQNCSVFNLTKARTIVLWILKTQRLQMHILVSLAADILLTLTYALSTPLETSDMKLEAFTIIHKLNKEHPRLADSLIGLLDPMLNHLNAETLDLRICASLALCGFAIAKLKSEDGSPYPRSNATSICCAFLNQDAKRSELWGPTNRLPNILKTALTNNDFWDNLGPSFGLAVVSSLIVLIDRFIWETPRALKMLVNAIAFVAGHRRSNIRRLHPELWRMMIWTFSRLPTGNLPPDSQESKSPEGLRSMREKALNFLLQERRHGLLADVVYTLLCPGNGELRTDADLTKALGIVGDLLSSGDSASKDDGLRLLGRMLVDIRRPSPIDSSQGTNYMSPKMFSWALVDGTLAKCKTKDIRVHPFTVEMERIPPLCEHEVTVHWDELCRCWTKAVQICLEQKQDLSTDLLAAWQTLLLVRGEVVPSHDHFTASPSFAAVIRDVFKNLTSPIESSDAHTRYLMYLLKLWGVLKNVFTYEWLAAPARMVFEALLQGPFAAANGDAVKDAWATVCRELIGAAITSLLQEFESGAEDDLKCNTSRKTWLVIAQSDYFGSAIASLKDVVRFLAIPIRKWDLSVLEYEGWSTVLDAALQLGTRSSLSQHAVISHFLDSLGDSKLNSLKADLRFLQCILSRSMPGSHSQVDSRLLTLITGVLRESYGPPVKDDEEYGQVLSLLRSFGILLSSVPPAEIVRFLSTTQESLIPWISDERELLQKDIHTEVVTILYKRPLEILAKVEPSITALTDIADFLHSVFLRIRGDGVLAFSSFWRATYHVRQDIPKSAYPAPIKACLRAWSDFCDDSLADNMNDTQSQSQSLGDSPIPDSQLASSVCFDDEAYIQEYEMMFAEEVAARSAAPATPGDKKLPQSGASSFASSSTKGFDSRMESFRARGGHCDASNLEKPAGDSDVHGSSPVTVKRRSVEPETPNTKRRRIDMRRISFKPKRTGKARLEEWSISHRSNRGVPLKSISEPASLLLSPMDPQPSAIKHSASLACTIDAADRNVQSPDSHDTREDVTKNETTTYSSEDDYDSWERGISVDDFRIVHDVSRVGSDVIVPDSKRERDFVSQTRAVDVSDQESNAESVSLSQYAPRGHGRSQTAPITRNESGNHPRPLRRGYTSPGPSGARPATPLDALRDAYTALADAGDLAEYNANSDDDDDVEEILQARRLVHQISTALDKRMGQKMKGKRKERR